ncbi:MAG: M2 family metallopeptidase [Sandaracinaceae bacterium]
MITPSPVLRLLLAIAVLCLTACGGNEPPPPTPGPEPDPTAPVEVEQQEPEATSSAQEEAEALLGLYDPLLLSLATEANRASWVARTDVSEEHNGLRTGAEKAYRAFTGNAELIRRAQRLLEREDELDDLTRRQLRSMLEKAAAAPMTAPDLARRRIEAESAQEARLDGFQFCLTRRGDSCTTPVTTNDLDRVLQESRDVPERLRAWEASKEVGPVLRDGLIELRGLRNGVAQEMGYDDFFAFQVSNYGMSTEEMMTLLEGHLEEIQPLYRQIHCWARHELAARYGVDEVPARIPAHWIGNRWAQSWPGMVEAVDMDALLADKSPEWIVQQAERFYVSMGFPELPDSFTERSDLYPVPEGEDRQKNAHASAWHIDLQEDVRSLMSVEPNWRWFTTTHHELGHIYYYLAYTRPEVPPLLRTGANRSYHEGIGSLIGLASSQRPYLEEVGLLTEGQEIDEVQWLLNTALTGPVVFLPFAAGTMSHFEKALYADELPPEQLNARWWELVARYQGVAPPSERPADGCDACTKTHINDDPAQYYDYALSEVLLYQLHDHICREIVEADPHGCNYANRRDVGDFLRGVLEVGATVDWREHLQSSIGSELSAAPMLEYYRPLSTYLEQQNQGRDCSWPDA